MYHMMWHTNNFLFSLLATLTFFIYYFMTMTTLTHYQKDRDSIDTFKRLGSKLIFRVKFRDQTCNIPKILSLPLTRS